MDRPITQLRQSGSGDIKSFLLQKPPPAPPTQGSKASHTTRRTKPIPLLDVDVSGFLPNPSHPTDLLLCSSRLSCQVHSIPIPLLTEQVTLFIHGKLHSYTHLTEHPLPLFHPLELNMQEDVCHRTTACRLHAPM
jgi:hypothetical protein